MLVQAQAKYNELPAGSAFVTIRFLLTEVSYNVALKYTMFHKLIINFIITICIHYNRMPRNTLPKVMKHYCATGRRNHGRPF